MFFLFETQEISASLSTTTFVCSFCSFMYMYTHVEITMRIILVACIIIWLFVSIISVMKDQCPCIAPFAGFWIAVLTSFGLFVVLKPSTGIRKSSDCQVEVSDKPQ